MARGVKKLSAKAVAAATKPGYYGDGAGLYLQVSASGSKSWIFRFMLTGRAREMGLGPLHAVSLADARKSAEECRKHLIEGMDPISVRERFKAEQRRAYAAGQTFRECAASYIKTHRSGWKNAKHADQWTNTLETYCGPVFGNLPVQSVDTPLVLKALEPIWTEKPETASRLRARIENVLDWATVRGYRDGDNPARWRGHLQQLLAPVSKKKRAKRVTNHPALPYERMGEFMHELRAIEGEAARALEFLILTASRTVEVTGAKPGEFDLDKATWARPAERMKNGKEHRQPLCPRAVELLRDRLHGEYVFKGRAEGRPLSNMAMLALIKRMNEEREAQGKAKWMDPRVNREIVPHGFRSSFRDWSAERTSYPREVCEMALAHSIGNEVEAAYRRGDLLDKRHSLMNDWQRFCDTPAAESGKVVAIRKGAK